MYWDDAVIFGLVTVGLVVAFMAGWVGFVIHDHRRHAKQAKSDQGRVVSSSRR